MHRKYDRIDHGEQKMKENEKESESESYKSQVPELSV